MDTGQAPPTDSELVHRARKGEHDAFHLLVDRHSGALYALAVSLVGNAADAEDVVQEALTAAFSGLKQFEERSSVRTWLTQILMRQAWRHYRQKRRAMLVRPESRAHSPSQQRLADVRMDVTDAILKLEPEFREVIVLRELEAMSYDQIAAVLDVPKGTVESRLHRARRALQELLREHLP